MTREEAIRTLQFGEWWDFLSGEIGYFAESTLHEALNLAISALREQEERENRKPLSAFLAKMDS